MAKAATDKLEIAMSPLAIGVCLLAFFSFSFLDSSAKWLVTSGYAVGLVVWVRFVTQGVILFAVFKGWRNKRLWAMQHPLLQILRGLALPAMTLFNFMALEHLQLSETISVLMATPILVAALAGPFLGEWAGPRRWAAIMVGFIGVLIVIRPGIEIISLPIMFIIASTLCNALYFLLTRKLAAKETPESLIFYTCFFAMFIFAPFAWPHFEMPSRTADLLIFIVPGLAGMIGHMLVIKASALTDASKITPFMYTQVIYMAVLGYFIFGDIPDGWTISGTMVVAASGLYLWFREYKLRKQKL